MGLEFCGEEPALYKLFNRKQLFFHQLLLDTGQWNTAHRLLQMSDLDSFPTMIKLKPNSDRKFRPKSWKKLKEDHYNLLWGWRSVGGLEKCEQCVPSSIWISQLALHQETWPVRQMHAQQHLCLCDLPLIHWTLAPLAWWWLEDHWGLIHHLPV